MSDTKPTKDERKDETPAAGSVDGATEKVDVPDVPPKKNGAKADELPSPPDGPVESDEKDEADTANLLPVGNPPRWKRGMIALLAGALPAFLLMAKNGQSWWAIPLGFLFICVAAFGVMDLHGTFDDAEEHVVGRVKLETLFPALGGFLGLAIAFCASISMAQHGMLPSIAAAVLVPATFLGTVSFVFRLGRDLGPWKTDEIGEERSLLHRHGFWVIVLGTLLYFPLLGVFSLWDPWETHYGEVAREIVARDDWISLWWAQDGWFWSKPILNFWIQSLSMGTLGTHVRPDEMLIGFNGVANAHPEWVVRTPNVLMTIGAMYALYKGVAKVFGRRAGLMGAIVLATMPDWFFLAHQTMTDMPFVAAMTAAMGLLLYGLNTDEEQRVRNYEIEAFGAKIRVSLWHLVFGAVLVCSLPQILYLLTRNLELVLHGDGPKGFRVHWDEFRSGSAGNCGLPGNEACNPAVPASLPKTATWWYTPGASGPKSMLRFFGAFEPALQGIVWACVLGGMLYVNWGERRVRRIVYVMAWLCAAIATMAKGPAGFGLPIICAFGYVATKRRWSEILRFEMVSGFLVIFCVALPWYVAMYVRHGSPFTDRLIFHDMFNRAFSHVHDTNEGDDTGIRYYIWQLGYATFPWSGIVPFALLWSFRRSDSALGRFVESVREKVRAALTPADDVALPPGTPGDAVVDAAEAPKPTGAAVGDASIMLVMWFLFAYFLFTFMGTKFHHYIFPAVPPAAMLVGIVLDDMLGKTPLTSAKQLPLYFGGLAAAAVLAVYGASRLWFGSPFGTETLPAGEKTAEISAGQMGMGAALLVVGIAAAAFVIRAFRHPDEAPLPSAEDADEDVRRRSHEQTMLGAAAMAAAVITLIIGRDLARTNTSTDGAGAIRLLQLFTYNYKRPWPETLDFSGVLNAFTVVAAIALAALALKKFRPHVVAALSAFALLWGVWGTDVYMIKLSPHWGQHEVIQAYYDNRKDASEQLVAYQMNWKGENIYTSNHIPAFVSTGATFQTWLKKEKDKGQRVFFLVTEHSRIGGLKSEVGAKTYKEITDKALCNKFILVRAEF